MSSRLSNERSPYLREQAESPIDWYPWGTEAFERARREDKPIFLSIGFASCHWCHVMAREAFSNAPFAELLNTCFISVKVDRDERPDIDSVYMAACVALNGGGGWPLNVFMTPGQRPFFATAYLPLEGRDGKAGLMPLARAVAEKWQNARGELISAADALYAILSAAPDARTVAADEALLARAKAALAGIFDAEYGGFGDAPRFPTPQRLIFLLRYAALADDRTARAMAEETLKGMYKGGIYDHFGGGFARYAVDREWLVPHFEKTLCNNALLAYTYAEAWQGGHFALFRTVAESVLDYCMRELSAPGGGYYCAQDADADGSEGEYYLFTPQEVCEVLGADGKHFCECYDITAEGNFNGRSVPNLILNNRWYLLPEGYEDMREKLRLYREERHTLKTDTKILSAPNGLMLMALAKAAYAFSDARYLAAAEELERFMRERLFMGGRMYARLCEGELKYPAQLDDIAFYALGLCELYRANYDPALLAQARDCADVILTHFSDGLGGLYRTADDAEALFIRPREVFDGANLSGAGGTAMLFDVLGRMTGDMALIAARDDLIARTLSLASDAPAGVCATLCAALSLVYPTRALVCTAPGEAAPELLRLITARYAPELSVLLKTPRRAGALAAAAPYTAGAEASDAAPRLYICKDGILREAK